MLAADCHKPASRYPVITSHLAGMISPSLPCPFSPGALLGIFIDNYHIQATRDLQVSFVTLYFNYNKISLLSILVISLYICLLSDRAGQLLGITQVWVIFANAIGSYLALPIHITLYFNYIKI